MIELSFMCELYAYPGKTERLIWAILLNQPATGPQLNRGTDPEGVLERKSARGARQDIRFTES
jgi:hypothetical protein